MKKLCLILAFLFLFTQTASAMPLLIGQKVVYRGTVTGLRISAVDGTAFIDNLPYVYSSDFSAGDDGWTADGGTVAGNIDSIGGQDDVLRLTIGATASRKYIRKSLLTVKKTYTITFKYYIPSGQSNVDSISLNATYWGGTTTTLSVVDTWTIVSKTFTANNASPLFFAADGGKVDFTDAGGDDVFYIKDVTISEITPYMDGNHQIEIYDASNRMLRGVLKAAGTSEGLTELVTNGNMETGDPPSNWGSTGVTIDGVADERTGGAGSQSLEVTSTTAYTRSTQSCLGAGFLVKYNLWAKLISGSAVNIKFGDTTDLNTTSVTWANLTGYKTATSPSLGLGGVSAGAVTRFDDISFQKVLAPSSSGATIVSAKGGETYNFSYKNPSFTYNAASYYVIIRAIR